MCVSLPPPAFNDDIKRAVSVGTSSAFSLHREEEEEVWRRFGSKWLSREVEAARLIPAWRRKNAKAGFCNIWARSISSPGRGDRRTRLGGSLARWATSSTRDGVKCHFAQVCRAEGARSKKGRKKKGGKNSSLPLVRRTDRASDRATATRAPYMSLPATFNTLHASSSSPVGQNRGHVLLTSNHPTPEREDVTSNCPCECVCV